MVDDVARNIVKHFFHRPIPGSRLNPKNDVIHEFFGCHGSTLTRFKFLLRLLNVSDQFFPAALDNATMQNLPEGFLIFRR